MLLDALNRADAQLRRNPQLAVAKSRVVHQLETAFAGDSQTLTEFLDRFCLPHTQRPAEVRTFLRGKSRHVRAAADAYLNFAQRFMVGLRLTGDEWITVAGVEFGPKFHVIVKGNDVTPFATRVKGKRRASSWVDHTVAAPGFNKKTDVVSLKFLLVENAASNSVIDQLAGVAYFPDAVTFIRYSGRHAERLLCFIGERVTDKQWRAASLVRSALQRQIYGTGKRGRKMDMDAFEKLARPAQQPGSLKDQSAGLVLPGTAKDVDRAKHQLLRTRRRLRGQPSR